MVYIVDTTMKTHKAGESFGLTGMVVTRDHQSSCGVSRTIYTTSALSNEGFCIIQ